jgi:hypothetical protein
MKRILSSLAVPALAALLLQGCAGAKLSKDPAWEKSKAPAALLEDAKAGKFHRPLERMMDVAQYMFETEGFLFTRRDDDTKVFKTAPFKMEKDGLENMVQLTLTQEGELTLASWQHIQIVEYKDVDACKDDPACQQKFNLDWNWRLFQHLP